MSTKSSFKTQLIAPCGMNCGICLDYLRNENKCPGCRNIDETHSKYCRKCIIRNCNILKANNWKYCFNKCEKYPCLRLRNLDKRYRTKYGMSMIENLENISKDGIKKFVNNEKKRWTCSNCKKSICVHRPSCIYCGTER